MITFLKLLLTIALTVSPLFIQAAERYPIIPKPRTLVAGEGTCTINPSTRILINQAKTKELATFIADFLAIPLNATLSIGEISALSQAGTISIIIDDNADIEPEGYLLMITPENITINARTITGAFWAFSTLRQLMPPQTHSNMPLASAEIRIPCVAIKDAPRFSYRGLHLDVSRHLFPVDFIKKYIDLMAFYKLNTFHWHLTDDQGWRIEIKRYPRLQEIAAYRDQTIIGHDTVTPEIYDGKRYGGYYTQEEIKDIVEFARKRNITIIPEIELPGHCVAVLAAYPHLGCTGGPYKTRTRWGIETDVYCAGNDEVFTFLQDILQEVMELFPSTYIHIGGDEVLKDRWKLCAKCQNRMYDENLKGEQELQSYFVAKIERFLNNHGRQIIGWNEILEGGLAPRATVMSWEGADGGIKAAQLNHNVVMTPYQYLYLNQYQSKSPYEPLAFGNYLPLEKVYQYEPVPTELNEEQAHFILGAQACLWTEYITDPRQAEYMAFPRVAALAELAWTPAAQKDYADFSLRLKNNLDLLRAMGIYYAHYL